ncbi:protein obstructor-E [Nilaparvata lugens]|uniref:protein obstructor-E n=1 Tax=Nilaparvata lugens TaxID=108931 RepID=UPI000B99A088|nr:protein obstructor-E [Nilaparvata lugens]
MWFNNNSPTTTTAVLLLFVIGAVVAQSRTPGKRPSSSREAAKRPPPQSSSAESSGGAGGDLTDECPEPNGYFADGYQCDKYYECRDGAITEKLCPDGMVFNDYSINHEKCDLPFNIDCSQRSELQKPKPALHCPRQNGYFAHEEVNVCDKFYYCVDGKFNQIVCPDGLVYNEKTGICTWPDEAKKKGCSSQEVFKFTCPAVGMSEAQQHPRYADPEDCQYFYVCINGETPRRNGCKRGQVFNDATKNCDWPRNVPECGDWYKGILTDAELEELEHPKPKQRPDSQAATANRRKQSNKYRPHQSSREAPVDDLE